MKAELDARADLSGLEKRFGGYRVNDLIKWACNNHKDEVKRLLAAKEAIRNAGPEIR